jgi:hypothetical protein
LRLAVTLSGAINDTVVEAPSSTWLTTASVTVRVAPWSITLADTDAILVGPAA